MRLALQWGGEKMADFSFPLYQLSHCSILSLTSLFNLPFTEANKALHILYALFLKMYNHYIFKSLCFENWTKRHWFFQGVLNLSTFTFWLWFHFLLFSEKQTLLFRCKLIGRLLSTSPALHIALSWKCMFYSLWTSHHFSSQSALQRTN